MADKNTTSNINLAAAEELPKAQSKFKEFVKKFMKRKTEMCYDVAGVPDILYGGQLLFTGNIPRVLIRHMVLTSGSE